MDSPLYIHPATVCDQRAKVSKLTDLLNHAVIYNNVSFSSSVMTVKNLVMGTLTVKRSL